MDDHNKTLATCLALALALAFSHSAIAAKKLYPNGCTQRGFSFKYHALLLHPDAAGQEQSLFFLHNKSMKTVKLFQMRSGHEPYIMHINNTIKPNQWGVFSTDEKQVRFMCANPKKGSKYGKVVDCRTALELCEYVNVKYSINTRGNYWSVSSNSKKGAIRSVVRQGILLKW